MFDDSRITRSLHNFWLQVKYTIMAERLSVKVNDNFVESNRYCDCKYTIFRFENIRSSGRRLRLKVYDHGITIFSVNIVYFQQGLYSCSHDRTLSAMTVYFIKIIYSILYTVYFTTQSQFLVRWVGENDRPTCFSWTWRISILQASWCFHRGFVWWYLCRRWILQSPCGKIYFRRKIYRFNKWGFWYCSRYKQRYDSFNTSAIWFSWLGLIPRIFRSFFCAFRIFLNIHYF